MWENSGKDRAEIITKGKGNPFIFTRKNAEGYIWEDWVKLAELFKMAFTVSGGRHRGIKG